MRKKKEADSRLSRSNMMSNTLLTYARGYEAKDQIQSRYFSVGREGRGAKAQYPKCGGYAVVIVTYSVGLVGKIGLLCSLWMLAY